MPDPKRQDEAGVTYCNILACDCNTSSLLGHFFWPELLVPGSSHTTYVIGTEPAREAIMARQIVRFRAELQKVGSTGSVEPIFSDSLPNLLGLTPIFLKLFSAFLIYHVQYHVKNYGNTI